MTTPHPRGKFARLAIQLSEYDFESRHRAGTMHINVDALSRLTKKAVGREPLENELLPTTAYMDIDIWTQLESLLRIQEADVEEDSPLRQYEWKEGVLWKTFPNGIKVHVPPPNERDAIIRDVHEKQGHLGRSRTYKIVNMQYWWACIYKDSMRVVSQCRDCDRAKNSPVMRHDMLHPLTIQPLFFRFHMDTCPKLPCTTR